MEVDKFHVTIFSATNVTIFSRPLRQSPSWYCRVIQKSAERKCINPMPYVSCALLLLSIFISLSGCATEEALPEQIHWLSGSDWCTPDRGENQDVTVIVHGQAYNSTDHECI